ncbi:MAG: hypothetical protein ACM3QS_15835 [Bacteroidota bacterium]
MAHAGHRYRLLMYTRMLDRWWPAVLWLAAALFALAWAVRSYFPDPVAAWRWQTLGGVGVIALLLGLFFLIISRAAYVQPRGDHLRLVTPFLRLNISYKRLRRATSATMEGLFPYSSVSPWRREILEPLAKRTAIVVELNGYPISQSVLRLFLSPFFFKDKTPHFVLLVDDWMRLSSELETLRLGGEVGPRRRVERSILSRLPRE